MNIKINKELYNTKKGEFTYYELAKNINKKWGTNYNESGICKAFKGSNKSYKLHSLICNELNLNIKEVLVIE